MVHYAIGLDKQMFERKIVNICLLISFNICFVCLKDSSRSDGSFDYPQNMLLLRNNKMFFFVCTPNLRPAVYFSFGPLTTMPP